MQVLHEGHRLRRNSSQLRLRTDVVYPASELVEVLRLSDYVLFASSDR